MRTPVVLQLTAALALAQSASTVWDGVYSAPQAAKGAALYGTQCASCHGTDLMGSGPFPALTGDDFRKEWEGQTVGDLFERLRTTMPASKPGSLSAEQSASLVAYILKSNGYPAGPSDLKSDGTAPGTIRFTKK